MASLASKAKSLTTHDDSRLLRAAERRAAQAETRVKVLAERLKHTEEDLRQAESRFGLLLETDKHPTCKRLAKGASKPSGQATAIISMTDWHVEESVEPGAVSGLNKFDLDIADKRIERSWGKAIRLVEFARKLSDIREVVIWLGGDFIAGYIHEELQESNNLSPAEAMLWAQDRIHNGIKRVVAELKPGAIRVVANFGNHGRTTQKKRCATRATNSFEYLAYQNLARFCRADGMATHWNIAEGYHAYETIQGHEVRFHHGDAIRFQGGIGGIAVPVNKAISQWNKGRHADLDIFGHWHQYLDYWNFVSVGCLVGYGPFSLEIKADFQPPTQAVIVVDRERGKVMSLPIFCEAAG